MALRYPVKNWLFAVGYPSDPEKKDEYRGIGLT